MRFESAPHLLPAKSSSPVSYTPVFTAEHDFHAASYFYLTNNILPSVVEFNHIDRQNFYSWVIDFYKVDEAQVLSRREVDEKTWIRQAYIPITEYAAVYITKDQGEVNLLYDPKNVNEDFIRNFSENIVPFRFVPSHKYINLIVRNCFGLALEEFKIIADSINTEEHYNDDFKAFDSIVRTNLEDDGQKGIILFHGTPGTGKTSYIKHLVSTIKRRFIYLPPNMANSLAEPDFISFLSTYPDSVLIIEDAEEILACRDGKVNPAMSNLLGLGDGLLSDCLRIRVICTFNAKLNRIDPAILRKGRIIARYEFRALDFEKAKRLALKNNFNYAVEGPMTLAEIFNPEKPSAEIRQSKSIGFLKN